MFCIVFSLCIFSVERVDAQGNKNYREFKDSKALYQFYQRIGEKQPTIIQGHRGTREHGLPENSIAAFEYVLSQMPAIFEIDPRLTKDSVVVVFHDATLERTSNGTGRVEDHTWLELQKLNLKNAAGDVTEYKIPTLSQVLEWARGKTVLILDKKNVPLQIIADLLRKHDANSYVINMVRSTEDALFYYRDEPRRMFSVSIRNPETYFKYINAGIPKEQMFACMGTELSDDMIALTRLLHDEGVSGLIATASSYDKLPTREERAKAYRKIAKLGIDIIESDYPTEVAEALKTNTRTEK